MNPALQPFLTVAMPIMVTFVLTISVAAWGQNKRFEDLSASIGRRFAELSTSVDRRFAELSGSIDRRFAEVIARFHRIERKLDNHEERIVRLEERTSMLRI